MLTIYRLAYNVLRLGTVATDYFHFYLLLSTPLCLGAVTSSTLFYDKFPRSNNLVIRNQLNNVNTAG